MLINCGLFTSVNSDRQPWTVSARAFQNPQQMTHCSQACCHPPGPRQALTFSKWRGPPRSWLAETLPLILGAIRPDVLVTACLSAAHLLPCVAVTACLAAADLLPYVAVTACLSAAHLSPGLAPARPGLASAPWTVTQDSGFRSWIHSSASPGISAGLRDLQRSAS